MGVESAENIVPLYNVAARGEKVRESYPDHVGRTVCENAGI